FDRPLRIEPQQIALVVLVALIAAGLLRGPAAPAAPRAVIIVATPTLPLDAAARRGAARPIERAAPPAAIHPLPTVSLPEPPHEDAPIAVMRYQPAAAPTIVPPAAGD